MPIQPFLHLTGVATWLGAGFVFLVVGPSAGAETWAALARMQRVLIVPAAVVAVITGITMTMGMVSSHAEMSASLVLMLGCGIVAAPLTVAASRMTARKPQLVLTAISTLLVLVGIYCGVARF